MAEPKRPDSAWRRLAIMRADFSNATKLVLIRVLDLQGLNLGCCTKSASKLAIDCGLTEAGVRTALKQGKDLLESEGEEGQRARRRLRLDKLDALYAEQEKKVAADEASHREQKRARRVEQRAVLAILEAREVSEERNPDAATPGVGSTGRAATSKNANARRGTLEERNPDAATPGCADTRVPQHRTPDAATSAPGCPSIGPQMQPHRGIPERDRELHLNPIESASSTRAREVRDEGPGPERTDIVAGSGGDPQTREALAIEAFTCALGVAGISFEGHDAEGRESGVFGVVGNLAFLWAAKNGWKPEELLDSWADEWRLYEEPRLKAHSAHVLPSYWKQWCQEKVAGKRGSTMRTPASRVAPIKPARTTTSEQRAASSAR